jgi:hypothetical protein
MSNEEVVACIGGKEADVGAACKVIVVVACIGGKEADVGAACKVIVAAARLQFPLHI